MQLVAAGYIGCSYLVSENARLEFYLPKKYKSDMSNERLQRCVKVKLSDAARKERKDLFRSLQESSIGHDLDPNALYALRLRFYLRKNFMKRDTDNMIKISTDVISKYHNINDSHFLTNQGYKYLLDSWDKKDNREWIYYEIFKLEGKETDYTRTLEGVELWKRS